MSIPITYEMQDGRMIASILLPNGQRLASSVDMAPVVGAVCDEVGATDAERLAAFEMVGGVDIVGAICGDDDFSDYTEVGARKKRRAKRRARRKRIMSKVKRGVKRVAKPLIKAGKKLAKSKLVKGLAKVVKKIPIYGQLISAASKGLKGAVKAGRKIARKVRGARGGRLIKGGRIKKAFAELPGAARRGVAKKAAKSLRMRGDGSLRALSAPPSRAAARGPGRARAKRLGAGRWKVQLESGRTATVQL